MAKLKMYYFSQVWPACLCTTPLAQHIEGGKHQLSMYKVGFPRLNSQVMMIKYENTLCDGQPSVNISEELGA